MSPRPMRLAWIVSAPVVSRKDVGLRSERGPILLAVMLSVGLVAIDTTILATAVPAVVDDLGGFDRFPWLFSVYLLAQAVTVPIYGKVADMVGRKPIMLLGVGIFVLGSLLCGLAWGMGSLIVFRALQGIGAGAVQPMGMTIMGDIYSVAERAKAQGYIASVWAAAALVGPTLGGVFADYVSWRWIFFVNLPVGIAALWLIQRNFAERVERREHHVDVLGAVLLTGGGVLLLLGLLEGGQGWAWTSPTSFGVLAGAVVLLVAFGFVERRAVEPVLPLWVFRDRVLNVANLATLLVGMVMLGLTSYVPVFAQGVLGTGAVVAGLALAGMLLGWPLAASNSGRIYVRHGFRAPLVLGGMVGAVGGLLLTTIDGDSPVWWVGVPCFVVGVGFGLIASPAVIAAQSSVGWEHRGVATGTLMFGRNVGSALGVAVFGAVVNGIVRDRAGSARTDLEQLPADVLEPAIHAVFLLAAGVLVLLAVVAALMPARLGRTEA